LGFGFKSIKRSHERKLVHLLAAFPVGFLHRSPLASGTSKSRPPWWALTPASVPGVAVGASTETTPPRRTRPVGEGRATSVPPPALRSTPWWYLTTFALSRIPRGIAGSCQSKMPANQGRATVVSLNRVAGLLEHVVRPGPHSL
jgi:hypothetical protein